MNLLKAAYENGGRSHITWLLCLVIGTVAFFKFNASPNLSFFLTFLAAAGGFTTWRSVSEDKTGAPPNESQQP